MDIGIVGLPNVGKSSLFNALTGAGIAAENFPFTTIEPNVGIVPIEDERLALLADEWESAKITPAGIRFVDIAGLVKGASQGEGLGNQFLGNIRGVDAICHVIRCFEDDNVVNVMEELNPVLAADTIETELLLADLQSAEQALERVSKKARSQDKKFKLWEDQLKEACQKLEQSIPARQFEIDPELAKEVQFLTAKPVLYVANTSEEGGDAAVINPLKERAEKQNSGFIQLCTKLEAEIIELPPEERIEFYATAGITTPGLSRLADAGRALLNLTCFFTAGEQETRAWLVPKGTPAPRAAGKIHTDIERGFIRAEVYNCEDLKQYGSYSAVKEKGRVRLEGKDYIIQEGDVCYFRFSV